MTFKGHPIKKTYFIREVMIMVTKILDVYMISKKSRHKEFKHVVLVTLPNNFVSTDPGWCPQSHLVPIGYVTSGLLNIKSSKGPLQLRRPGYRYETLGDEIASRVPINWTPK